MTKIEWTEETWNPIVGCSIVSRGCTNCYAMRQAARRLDKPGSHYEGTTKVANGNAVWTGKVACAPEHIWLEPLRRKKPTMFFVNSMGDLFHEDVPDEWIDRVFAIMALTPQHTYQVLTKRSVRMREYIYGNSRCRIGEIVFVNLLRWPDQDKPDDAERWRSAKTRPWPLPNVWLGVSTEDQAHADERIPDLLATPAAVRFISAEPLLGPIDLTRVGNLASVSSAMPKAITREKRGRPDSGAGSICGAQIDSVGSPGSSITFFQTPDHMGGFTAASPREWPRLDWVIVGGESGKGARPMHPDWVRSLRDQCDAANVPFFFKQMTKKTEIPDDLLVREFPNAR